jgi:hypothetical protein
MEGVLAKAKDTIIVVAMITAHFDFLFIFAPPIDIGF